MVRDSYFSDFLALFFLQYSCWRKHCLCCVCWIVLCCCIALFLNRSNSVKMEATKPAQRIWRQNNFSLNYNSSKFWSVVKVVHYNLNIFFFKIEFFEKFLPLCNYLSWNSTNTISIWVCGCLGNTPSYVKGVKRYSHYKHYWVKIKTFDGSKLFFPDTSYTELGGKP